MEYHMISVQDPVYSALADIKGKMISSKRKNVSFSKLLSIMLTVYLEKQKEEQDKQTEDGQDKQN